MDYTIAVSTTLLGLSAIGHVVQAFKNYDLREERDDALEELAEAKRDLKSMTEARDLQAGIVADLTIDNAALLAEIKPLRAERERIRAQALRATEASRAARKARAAAKSNGSAVTPRLTSAGRKALREKPAKPNGKVAHHQV